MSSHLAGSGGHALSPATEISSRLLPSDPPVPGDASVGGYDLWGSPEDPNMPPQMRQEMICLDMIYSQTTSVEIVDLPVSPLSASDSDFQGNETHGAEAYERILRVFQDALQILNQMVESDVVHLSSINHALADCSKNFRWRSVLGASGILKFYIDLTRQLCAFLHEFWVATSSHPLRVVANSIADHDGNRQIALDSGLISVSMDLISNRDARQLAVNTLCNLCINFEPAQLALAKRKPSPELLGLLKNAEFLAGGGWGLVGHICELLESIHALVNDQYWVEESATIIVGLLNNTEADFDTSLNLLSILKVRLASPEEQARFVKKVGIESLLSFMAASFVRFEGNDGICREGGVDNECSAESMRAELIQLLSDLSILEEYQSSYPTHTSANKLLQDWLLQPQDQLQICACIILGNQASSDDRSLQFVQDDKLHQILLPILVVSKNPELLYAAVSFLRNLALPSRNKETLGSVRTLAVLGRLLNPDNLDRIKVAAARAARQLLIGQFANGYRMLQPIFVDERFPSFANSTTDQFLQAWQGATDPGLKTEIARVLTGMLRQLQKLKATHAEEASALWKLMEDTCQGGLAYPFGALILEKSDRALTVEGWLALRILAQFESGAIMVEQLFEETPYRMALVATICNVINSHAPKADPAAMLTMPPVPTSAGLLKKLSEGQSGVDVVNRINAHAVVASLLEYRAETLLPNRKRLYQSFISTSA